MKFSSVVFWAAALLGSTLLLTPQVLAAFDEAEEVTIVNRTPDTSNPLYETDTVEGGVSFYVPKGTVFVRKYGVISPVDPLEFLTKKIDGLKSQIKTLSDRVDVLERNTQDVSGNKNQRSL